MIFVYAYSANDMRLKTIIKTEDICSSTFWICSLVDFIFTTIYWHRTSYILIKTVRVSESQMSCLRKLWSCVLCSLYLHFWLHNFPIKCTVLTMDNPTTILQGHLQYCKKIYAQRMACMSSLTSFSQTFSDA